jgi:16S rRNA (cytidine1402-2'-O)-methyltransferase
MSKTGTLYIVATPIGNLADLSTRGKEVLSNVDHIAAEDTRHTKKLLSAKGISTPTFSYYEGKRESRSRSKIIELLLDGKDVALVSDAGSPCVSDPGYPVVRDAVDAGCEVTVVPGPCAAIAALQVSALPSDAFAFFGFLPRKGKDRKKRLDLIERFGSTSIIYESPVRLLATLTELCKRFPGAQAAVGRELTKMHEQVARGSIDQVLLTMQQSTLKGEVVIVLTPAPQDDPDTTEAIAHARTLRVQFGLSAKDAAAATALFTGISKRTIYERLINKPAEETDGNE